jgi:deoxyhypusine synthase
MDPRDEEALHDGFQDGLAPLQALDLSACGSVDALVRAMSRTAFGGRKTGEAADALERMIRDPECGVVMTLSGAMTIAKMGLVITEMIDRGMVQAIVSTGALIAHGFVEGVGGTHFKADPRRSDEQNYREGYNRVYDTLELERNLDDVFGILGEVMDEQPDDAVLSSSELHRLLGQYLVERRSGRGILQSAYQKGVPIFVPAFTDSELGIDFSVHNIVRANAGQPKLRFDPFEDLERFVGWAGQQQALGIFTIGGGVPRNWAQEIGPYVELLAGRQLVADLPRTRRCTGAASRAAPTARA